MDDAQPETSPKPTGEIPADASEAFRRHDAAERESLLQEMRQTIDRLERDVAARGDLKLLSRALKELRYAFQVFRPYRTIKKVTVFGSARTAPDHPDYKLSVQFGRRMATAGWMVVTGAGGGIMEGAHVGAGQAMSMGVNILLPFEQEANFVINGDQKLVTFRYFFTRKLMFVKEVHAVVLFPGGFGTMDELFELLTLIQTGKRDVIPIVLIETPGERYWTAWLEFIRAQLLGRQLISPPDLSLFRITDNIDDAVAEIERFYSVFDSMRFIRDKLVLRLRDVPSDELLERLNIEFASLVTTGKIERVPTHPHEYDESEIRHLPRIAFNFNRRETGRLRQLIDVLNIELAAANADEED